MMLFAFEPSFAVVLFAALGLAAGSFANVAIDRMSRGESLGGRSRCDACGRALRPLELVPVLGRLAVRGRCRTCKAPISMRFSVIECACGLLFIAAAWHAHFMLFPAVTLAIVLWAMLAIALIDARTRTIPDALTLALTLAALTYRLLLGDFTIIPCLVALAFFGLQRVLGRGRFVGGGDVLLAGALALLMPSVAHEVLAVMLCYILGAIVVCGGLFSGRMKRGSTIAFAPFLVVGAFVAVFFGDRILAAAFL